ncbi:fumarylacetoacetate hydrolase family protein [Conexibacter stalactiti]|uniref:Fumarylacetoacetate hydrolase family protein n=1 Tax=Conexibacter stalactiti TaxID=1940611 RepID=A0ABU4HTB2_9ACTN|nr:fumarylacetoacetate hydrolase family protein [Conexibacter stalactiti]MDW5596556.1 fumarylacetoacetate hydrolase family protein [Conexibacter stalactiti]MEC5037198.1 fumarylacetoacetate hydrolase family protein [Conexibacter stalactiti]
MRIGTVITNGTPTPVVERDGALVPLDVPAGTTVADLIAAGDAIPAPAADAAALQADAQLAAPLAPGKIVAIGLNYMDHVRETGLEKPTSPLVFTKFTTSVIGDGEQIRVDRAITQRVDWEVELAAVIGRTMTRVSVEDALSHVFGYTVANDVSARDVQFADGQWVRGKSLDTFCPLGPAIVTADEVSDPQALGLWTRVNGETVQDSNTKEMVFGVAELLSFCSHSFTLEPGDVVLTGTPWGCGEFMDPIRSLKAGDVVEVEVEGIGKVANPVVEI